MPNSICWLPPTTLPSLPLRKSCSQKVAQINDATPAPSTRQLERDTLTKVASNRKFPIVHRLSLRYYHKILTMIKYRMVLSLTLLGLLKPCLVSQMVCFGTACLSDNSDAFACSRHLATNVQEGGGHLTA